MAIPLGDCTPAPGSDRVTVTFLDGEFPRIVPLDPATDVSGDEIPVPIRHQGAACLLVHDEEPDMADLRQLTLRGAVRDGIFRAERRTGSLDPSRPSTLGQLRTLRALGRAARKNRPVLARWAGETRG
jgi:hypothetical protein